MAKYIDADLLRKEIDHRIDILEDVSIKCAKNDDMEMHNYYHGKAISLEELLHFIDSLQQEQTDCHAETEYKHIRSAIVREEAEKLYSNHLITERVYKALVRYSLENLI